MSTFKWYRISFAPICLTLMAFLTITCAKAGPTRQGETDFAA
jgi:hypothetical protein